MAKKITGYIKLQIPAGEATRLLRSVRPSASTA